MSMPMPLRYRFLACYRISAFRFWEWHAVGEDNDACRCLLMWHNGIHRPRFVAAVTANLRICNHFGVGDGTERRRDGGSWVRKRKRARGRERGGGKNRRGRSIYWNGRCTFRTGGTDRKDPYFPARPQNDQIEIRFKEKYSQSHTRMF